MPLEEVPQHSTPHLLQVLLQNLLSLLVFQVIRYWRLQNVLYDGGAGRFLPLLVHDRQGLLSLLGRHSTLRLFDLLLNGSCLENYKITT
jgi:hypothetical protein